MFYESLAFNEGGNDGFWRFQLRDRFGRWIKMGGSAMFEFRKPNDKNVYKAKGTFQGNIRRGWSIIRVGEGEQLPPGDYEIDSRYIESIKAIINTTSAKPETVDAPKSINPDVEKQAAEREMVAATVKDLEAGDIVQQSTEEALYGQINSVEHGEAESKINVTWSDGSNYDMTLPADKKIKIWGAEPEAETVDAPKPKSRFEAPTDPAEIEALKAKAEEQKARVAEVEKEREERLKLKAEQEAKAAESYRMAHRPPGRSDTKEEGVAASLDKIDEVFPEGILDPEKQQSLFRTGDAEADKETFDVINSIKGNPDAEVTIYRGVPDGVDAIGAGDWVTLSPSYAQHHVDANVPDGKVISKKVKASELFTNADSINEWGYDPEPETVDAGKEERPAAVSAREIVDTFRLWDAEAYGISNETFLEVKAREVSKPTYLDADGNERKNPQYGLEQDIIDNGIQKPIEAEIDSNGKPVLLEGHTRLAIMFKNNPDAKIPIKWIDVDEPETVDAPKVETEEDKVSAIWGDAAPNERDVVAAAYEKLPADMPIADVAVLDPDFATYPDSIKNDPESVKEVAIGAMQEIVRRWNGSSIYDDSTKALHEVAREHFGISGATPVEMTEGSKALMENKEAYKAVLDAIYASTQEMFANAGIEEITVYRGSKTDSSGVRPLSSWTTDKATAEAFAGKDGDTKEMTVPVSQVLSTAMSGGLGAWNENEVVLLGSPKTVDAGNVEEEAPEVPEATRVIDSEREASVLYQELSKKFNLTNSVGGAASARKRNAAKVTLDKMLADGVTLSQLADASKSIGPIAIKQGTNYWDALDFESVFNKLPETPGIGSLVSVNPYSIINAPYDDDTVMGSETYVNAMKFNEDGFLEVFTLNVVDTLDVKGLTLKEVQAQARSEPSISGFYGDFAVVGTTESKRMLAESFTSKLIQTWANTSNDTDADSLAIQEVARLLFNLEDAADWDVDDVLRGDVQDNLNAHGATYQSFLTAQYEVTQEFLEEQGIKEFTLYRGFTSKFKIDTGYTDSVLRPLSSFSTSKKQAEEFALPGGFDYAYVIDMVIPAEDVLSMPGLGFGCYEEEEIVVLGGKKSAFIEML